jgi:hypothetical protein
MPKTLAELAREALLVQDACNIGGVSRSFAQAMADLHAHVPGTNERNTHPITRVWIDKLSALAGIQSNDPYLIEEFKRVRELADTMPPQLHTHTWEEQPGEPPVDVCTGCGHRRY